MMLACFIVFVDYRVIITQPKESVKFCQLIPFLICRAGFLVESHEKLFARDQSIFFYFISATAIT